MCIVLIFKTVNVYIRLMYVCSLHFAFGPQYLGDVVVGLELHGANVDVDGRLQEVRSHLRGVNISKINCILYKQCRKDTIELRKTV